MSKYLILILLAQALVACASRSPQTRALIETRGPSEHVLLEKTPFIPQAEGDCGPGSLAMVLSSSGVESSLETLRGEVYDSKHKGTLPASLTASARSRGLMATPVTELKNLTEELKSGRPVIVLQNLGFSWMPKWHFGVVVGFDTGRQEMILHSGQTENLKVPMTHFERHWKLADHWGLVVFPSSVLSTADEVEHMKSASGLESAGHREAAELAYQSILTKWPNSSLALVGLGNISFARKDYVSSVKYLKRAQKIDPESKVISNNLAVAQSMTSRK